MKPKTISLIRHSIIAVVLGAGVFCLVFFLRGMMNYIGLSDAFLSSGAVLLGIAGLAFIGRMGTFDVLGYGMKRLVEQFTHNKDERYENAGDYSIAKKKKRQNKPFSYWVYLVLGGIELVLAIVFALLV